MAVMVLHAKLLPGILAVLLTCRGTPGRRSGEDIDLVRPPAASFPSWGKMFSKRVCVGTRDTISLPAWTAIT